MSQRNFYKVVIMPFIGPVFNYINDCRKIQGNFQGYLVPISKKQAESLPLPPNYVKGQHNCYLDSFTIQNEDKMVVNNICKSDMCDANGENIYVKKYDYSKCTITLNEFLLTDESLGLYKMSAECAYNILLKMFGFAKQNSSLLADGTALLFGEHMYCNIALDFAYLCNNIDGGVGFIGTVLSKDTENNIVDVLNTNIIQETRFMTTSQYFIDFDESVNYEYNFLKVGFNELESYLNKDVENYTGVINPITSNELSKEFDYYAFHSRKNLVNKPYDYVYANLTNPTWYSNKYYTNVNHLLQSYCSYTTYTTKSGISTFLKAQDKYLPFNIEGKYLQKYQVKGFNNVDVSDIEIKNVSSILQGEFSKVTIETEVKNDNFTGVMLSYDGKDVVINKEINKKSYTFELRLKAGSYHFIVNAVYKDSFGYSKGNGTEYDLQTVEYQELKLIPSVSNFNKESYYSGIKLSWDKYDYSNSDYEFDSYELVISAYDNNVKEYTEINETFIQDSDNDNKILERGDKVNCFISYKIKNDNPNKDYCSKYKFNLLLKYKNKLNNTYLYKYNFDKEIDLQTLNVKSVLKNYFTCTLTPNYKSKTETISLNVLTNKIKFNNQVLTNTDIMFLFQYKINSTFMNFGEKLVNYSTGNRDINIPNDNYTSSRVVCVFNLVENDVQRYFYVIYNLGKKQVGNTTMSGNTTSSGNTVVDNSRTVSVVSGGLTNKTVSF